MPDRRPPHHARGYTLIELLVVVVIAAVLAGVALLRLAEAGPERQVADQLAQLDARLDALCEHALLSGRPHGVRMTSDGYDFWAWQRGQWVTLAAGQRPAANRWPEGLRARLRVQSQPVLPTTARRPQLVCSGLEPFAPFEWELQLDGARAELRFPEAGR